MLIASMVVSAVVLVVCLWLIFRTRPENPPVVFTVQTPNAPVVSNVETVRILPTRAPRKKDCQREGRFVCELKAQRGVLWYCFWRDHSACGEKKRVAANRCYKFRLADCKKGV